MKSLAACSIILALAACSSSSGGTSSTGTGGTGASGGKSTGTTGTASGGRGASSTAAGSSTGSPLGMACDISGGTDPCQDVDLDCSADTSTTATTGVCVLPPDLQTCDPDTFGCQDGGNPQLNCSSGFVDGNGNDVDVCTLPCTTGADCAVISETCVPSVPTGCFPNPCAQFSATEPTPNEGDPCGGNLFGSDAGDGQCLGFVDSNSGTSELLCYQNGPAVAGDACNPFLRTGTDSECQYGTVCFPNGGGDGGLCYPLTLDGGCDEGEIALIGPSNPDFAAFAAAWGICAVDCTQSKTCVSDAGPAGLIGYGSCQLLSDNTTSACLP